VDNRFTDFRWIAKTDFTLCRVNVYIDGARIEIEEKKRNRILSFHEGGVIAFADGSSNEAAFDRTAVHKNEQLCTRLPAQARLSDQSANLNFGGSIPVYLNQAFQ
jgi:hypothetical protein